MHQQEDGMVWGADLDVHCWMELDCQLKVTWLTILSCALVYG